MHSNPNGRECLSYADEKRVDREKAEFEAEERWLREKSRGHRARHIARYVAGILVVFLISGAFLWRSSSSSQRIFRAELKDATELVDTAVEKITLARNEEEFDAFGSDIGSATQKKGSDNRKNDDIFGDFSTNSRSLDVLDPIKILLERSSVKLHNLLRQ